MQPDFEGTNATNPYLYYLIPGTPEVPRQFGRFDIRASTQEQPVQSDLDDQQKLTAS